VLAVVGAAGPALALAVGDKAPDFALPKVADRNAPPVKLADLTAKGPVVLYTFIQAFTAT
jgi:peroxiredoxin